MNGYQAIEVTDDYLCDAAFVADGAPDLLIAAAWAINGHRGDSLQTDIIETELPIDDDLLY